MSHHCRHLSGVRVSSGFFSHFPCHNCQLKVMGLSLTKSSIFKKTLSLPLQNSAVSSVDKFSSSGVVVMTDSEGFLHQQEASTASSNFSCPEGFRQCLSHPFACFSVSFLLLAPLLVSPTLHGPGGKSVRRLAWLRRWLWWVFVPRTNMWPL